jgi:hypothetical protein
LIEDLQSPLDLPAYIEGNSFEGFPHAHNALNPAEELRAVYRSFHTSGRRMHDAMVWKQSIIDGTFWLVVDAIRDLPVILVGPPHLSDLGRHLNLGGMDHIEIPPAGAPLGRHALLKRCITALLRASGGRRPPVILYQAGSLSYWLIYRLFPRAPHSFHLDLGRCLDVWYPEVGGRQPWFMENQDRIVSNTRLGHIYF